MIVNSRVYVYRQNNSGGYITKPAKFIIVEAENEPSALDKAKEAGLYLDGVSRGIDCSCCGDRWNNFTYEFNSVLEAKSYCYEQNGNQDANPYVVTTQSEGVDPMDNYRGRAAARQTKNPGRGLAWYLHYTIDVNPCGVRTQGEAGAPGST